MFDAVSIEQSKSLPNWRPPSAWTQHAPFAFWLIKAHAPRSFVELGTDAGYSFFVMCQAARDLGLDTKCTAIDTWTGDEHTGPYGSEVLRAVREEASRYGSRVTLKQSTFDEALPDFADHSIDLLHIDGRHFYEDVLHDWTTWKPKVSARGVVLFHDTRFYKKGFGVYKLWAEISRLYPSFEFYHGNGLGVLGFGDEIPDGVRAFFGAGQDVDTAARIRSTYHRLGAELEPSTPKPRSTLANAKDVIRLWTKR